MNYKFRGRMVDGKWAYGNMIEYGKECHIFEKEKAEKDSNPLAHMPLVHRETVGQWTGKTGMQNIELYSDDIIEYNGEDFPDAVGRRAVITYDEELARFVAGLGKNSIGPILWHECKKLGNIHDNPELLEGK